MFSDPSEFLSQIRESRSKSVFWDTVIDPSALFLNTPLLNGRPQCPAATTPWCRQATERQNG